MYSTTPTHGTLSGSAPNLTYIPNAGYIGPDAFTFRANDSTTNSNTATVSITVRGLAPVINSSVGYINGTPLTAHTSTAFKSTGSSTLVAFVSSHTPWNGLPQTVDWRFSSVLDDIVPDTAFKLFAKAREQSQIECLPLSVATRYPSYVSTERTRQLRVGEAVLGLILCSESGKRLGYFPAVEHLDQALLDRLDSLDVLLFDGTF